MRHERGRLVDGPCVHRVLIGDRRRIALQTVSDPEADEADEGKRQNQGAWAYLEVEQHGRLVTLL